MTKLTPRQHQIVRLLVAGHSQKQAARQLGLSPGAVRSYMTQARQRTGSLSTAQLVFKARKELGG